MRTTLSAAVAAVCVLGFAGPAASQAPGVEIRLNPRVGVYLPLTDLGDPAGTAATFVAEQSGNLALGLGLELDFGLLPVGLRANVDYATGSEITQAGVAGATERTVIMLAGDLMLRPLPKLILVQPYLFAGGGVRQYDFDEANTAGLEDADDPVVHLGGGLDLALGPLALNAELGDYISWFEVEAGADTEMQHDLFVSVGLVLRLL